jgi:hypothetical protein
MGFSNLPENIDWDHFPQPFNKELHYYLGRALEEFSHEGVAIISDWFGGRVLAHLRTDLDAPPRRLPLPSAREQAELQSRLEQLPQKELRFVVAFGKRVDEAFRAAIEVQQGQMALYRDVLRIDERVRRLDPSLPENAPIWQSAEVLRRHGDTLGISEEVMDMEVELPRPRGEEE